jgi:MFS family permease
MNFCVVVPVFLAMGFSLSFFGGITGYHSVYTQFNQINISTTTGAVKTHNSLIKGTTVASLNLGATLGCLSTMYLGNKFGRRYTILIGAAVGVAGTILQCAAFSLAQLIISRSKFTVFMFL